MKVALAMLAAGTLLSGLAAAYAASTQTLAAVPATEVAPAALAAIE